MTEPLQYEWCVCGHGLEAHEMTMKPCCAILLHKLDELTGKRCPCDEFKVDTLRYLEDLSDTLKQKENEHDTR